MKTLTLLIFIFLLNVSGLHSQIVKKDLSAEDYLINLEWNDSIFFSGKMSVVSNADNSKAYSAENFHSGYNSDKQSDLNNDGKAEYIVELETGSSRSDYNMYVIFDFTKGVSPVCSIHNAELVANVDKTPVIVSNMRMGNPALEARYSFVVKYENGKLIPITDPKESKVLKELVPFEEDYSDLIKSYAGSNDVCGDNSEVKHFYAAYIIQQKLVNNEEAGWKFFDKNYTCSNKSEIKAEIEKTVNENYSKITNSDSYSFNK